MPLTDDIPSVAAPPRGWLEPVAKAGFAENWDAELFGIRVPAWRWPVVRAIESLFHTGDGRPIVIADIGCGAATYARHLLTTGIPFEYHGFDHNPGILEAAAERWRFLAAGAPRFALLDAREPRWPIADRRFDVVLWDSTLRFVEDVPAAVRESARVGRRAILLARTPVETRTWREEVSYYGMNTPSTNWHFDRAYFERVAAQTGLTLSVSVGDADLQALTRGAWPEAGQIQPGVNLTRAFHEKYIRERVDRLLAAEPGPWSIYGAGRHTRWLLGVISESARRRVQAIVDDAARPGQTLSGHSVSRPESANPACFAGVVVSSDTIEDRLAVAAVRWSGDAARVHRLYAAMPPGPYDKAAV
ncbi:MAG: hypothetical protein AMXMBFR47_21890 [Planctomycetota bacterium]